jgi:hypothetical protein
LARFLLFIFSNASHRAALLSIQGDFYMKSIALVGSVAVSVLAAFIACGKKSSNSAEGGNSSSNATNPAKIEYYLPGGGSAEERKSSSKSAAESSDDTQVPEAPSVASGSTEPGPTEEPSANQPKVDTSQASASLWRGFCDDTSEESVTILLSANKRFVLKNKKSQADAFGRTADSFSGSWLVAAGSANLSDNNAFEQVGQCDVVDGSINGVDGLTNHLTCSFNENSDLVRKLGDQCSILHVARDFDVQRRRGQNKPGSQDAASTKTAATEAAKFGIPNTQLASFDVTCAGDSWAKNKLELLPDGLCSGFDVNQCQAFRSLEGKLVVAGAYSTGVEKFFECTPKAASAPKEDSDYKCEHFKNPHCRVFTLRTKGL